MNAMRMGQGFDVHAFGEGDHLMLGGVRIAHTMGLVAHSDGDVLLHALSDALLGSVAAGDIGQHFPDTEERWKGVDSRELLRESYRLVRALGYLIGNVDATLIAQEPRIAPYIEQMRVNIAADLLTVIENVSIKATTTERLGFAGRKEGIAAQVSLLVCFDPGSSS